LFVGLGFALIVPAAKVAQTGVKVSPWWLIGLYFLHTIGELCLSPVGLSIVTKLAPQRIVGAMMGVWFVSIAVGNLMAGMAGGLFQTLPLPKLFGAVAGAAFAAALILLAISPWLRKLMGGIR
jgi:POT family proton-dependent oligopeptide transporter